MAGDNTKYTEVRICTTSDMKRCFAVGVKASGEEDSWDLGVVHQVSDPDAVMADSWTPARLKSLPPDRGYSDAVLVGGMLVFVCALERLRFASEFIRQQGGADPFSGLPLGLVLQMLHLSNDSGFIHLPTLGGMDIFGVSHAS